MTRVKTWPEYATVMDRSNEKIIFWESKIIELSDGKLLAVAWTYDEVKGMDLPDHYTISKDGGRPGWNHSQQASMEKQWQ
jgi:sialidase-1